MRLAPVPGAQCGGSFFDHGHAASAQMDGGAQGGQLIGHRVAQPGSPASDEDALAAEQIRPEHALRHGLSPVVVGIAGTGRVVPMRFRARISTRRYRDNPPL
ncbi:hypothetical protein G6F57_019832 [Rhizopus arrhizus]|nr:hypothetical protein G6F57_019832 [Rhizopus arrhizus]